MNAEHADDVAGEEGDAGGVDADAAGGEPSAGAAASAGSAWNDRLSTESDPSHRADRWVNVTRSEPL